LSRPTEEDKKEAAEKVNTQLRNMMFGNFDALDEEGRRKR
jgi:hypothetical protein